MKSSVPELQVYFIDIATPEKKEKKQLKRATAALTLLAAPMLSPITLAAAAFLSADVCKDLRRFFDSKRFYIIQSEDDLDGFVNANGNAWVYSEKDAKARQYYVRHPKEGKRNLLIETQKFHDFIEEEYKEEIINYILSHCKATSIQINREEMASAEASAHAKVKGIEAKADVSTAAVKKVFHKVGGKRVLGRAKPREHYYWLEKSFMLSVDSMKRGSVLEMEFATDFTFGLEAEEVHAIGLEVGRQKKYTYYIRVEC